MLHILQVVDLQCIANFTKKCTRDPRRTANADQNDLIVQPVPKIYFPRMHGILLDRILCAAEDENIDCEFQVVLDTDMLCLSLFVFSVCCIWGKDRFDTYMCVAKIK